MQQQLQLRLKSGACALPHHPGAEVQKLQYFPELQAEHAALLLVGR
jgi:hypothetical protein